MPTTTREQLNASNDLNISGSGKVTKARHATHNNNIADYLDYKTSVIVPMVGGSGFYVADGQGNIGTNPDDATDGDLEHPTTFVLKSEDNENVISILDDQINITSSETIDPGGEDEHVLSSELALYPDHCILGTNREGGAQSFEITPEGTMVFTDVTGTKGAQYAADYSDNFTSRSLVDKEYVDRVGGNIVETFSDEDFTITRSCTLRFTGASTFNAVLPVLGTIPGLRVTLINEGSADANFLVLSGGLTLKNQATSATNTLAVSPDELMEILDDGTFYRVINKY